MRAVPGSPAHPFPAAVALPLPSAPCCSMSVSHPNCISTYKLSAIRLLRCHDLLDDQGSASSILRLSGNSSEAEDGAATLSIDDSARLSSERPQGRRLRSLLSGAEAEEVEDPYGPLQPGLYETWILSEVRGQRGARGWCRWRVVMLHSNVMAAASAARGAG